MAQDHRWAGGGAACAATARSSSTSVLARVRDEGPLVAGDLQQRVGPKSSWWDWDDGKIALEHLLYAGALTAVVGRATSPASTTSPNG